MSTIIATQRKLLPFKEEECCAEPDTKQDGEFRKLVIKTNTLNGSVGSSYVEMGNTKVVCSINGPKEQNNDSLQGTLNISIIGIETSIRYSIESALKAVVCLKKLARTQVDIELSVLADDGGSLAACLMAASVALTFANIECFDVLLATNILILNNEEEFILDPTRTQILNTGNNGTILTMGITPSLKQIVCTDVNGNPVKTRLLQSALKYGYTKCLEIYPIMSKVLHSDVTSLNFNIL